MSGSLFIVSAPSGAGKTTLVQALLANDPSMRLSVSYTTRAPRNGEINGTHYHFVSLEQFQARREAGEFLEWAYVHGNYYATSAIWLADQLAQGQDVLLEIDWQGAKQVRQLFRQVVDVFILPPSFEALQARLYGRGTDSEAVIEQRLRAAREEMHQATNFQYVIVNAELQQATEDFMAIIKSARLRCEQQRQRNPQLFNL